jgi:Protein of unknown function (DUF4058)
MYIRGFLLVWRYRVDDIVRPIHFVIESDGRTSAMPSPFPGMDLYIENPAIWPGLDIEFRWISTQ